MNASHQTVVLVDDEKTYVDFLAMMLAENLGWHVVTFGTAVAALDALAEISPAVIVTDYNMPGLDGFEFVRRAAPQLPGVPFIMISGHVIHLPEPDAGSTGALRSILPKPFGWRRLADEILLYAPELAAIPRPAEPTSA
ncbi:MAG TPA: response regulator [Opitutus sp.]|nr:response regulator [Opitutus sp.]